MRGKGKIYVFKFRSQWWKYCDKKIFIGVNVGPTAAITEADGVDTHVEGGGGSRKEDAREKEDSTRRKALICCFDCCIMSICPADRV